MEKNCIEEFQTSKNFRSVSFTYNEQNYEINISLYSNAILVFLSYNGKISNLYELNIDINEEQERNELEFMGENEEDYIKDIDLAECILGKRGNEELDFIANFIMTYIKDIIMKINSKITKICLSLSLDNIFIGNLGDSNKIKDFLNIVKNNIGKIFNVVN